jgi:NADPH:quinone reductase-like Zn-dependent oxidoreductase
VDPEFDLLLAHLNQEDLEFLAQLMESGKMTSVIDRTYALDEVPDAIRHSETGRARGKIVVSLVQ